MRKAKLAIIVMALYAFTGGFNRSFGGAATVNYVALVIGNSNYDIGGLAGPENDAVDMASALRGAGFEVKNVSQMINLNRLEMKSVINSFMSGLDRNSFAVIYYSGHGLEENNENYLIPVDAKFDNRENLEDKFIPLDWVLTRLNQREARTKIIILDACRNMPSALKYKGFGDVGGLADIKNLGPGVRVIYATSPGETARAADSGERNSVFTGALLDALKGKHSSFNEVINIAAQLTLERTDNQQTPWSAGVIGMSYVLSPQVDNLKLGAGDFTKVVYQQPDADVKKNCTVITQSIIKNGVSTWSKKCI